MYIYYRTCKTNMPIGKSGRLSSTWKQNRHIIKKELNHLQRKKSVIFFVRNAMSLCFEVEVSIGDEHLYGGDR